VPQSSLAWGCKRPTGFQISGIKGTGSIEAGIVLLEDNCESMGAKIGTKFTGTFGQIGTFSSFFSHHISTMEGGLSVTDDEELAQLMTSFLRVHGWTRELPETNHVHDKTGEKFDD
jgi:CDP-6-deoxy-D-xylo-4-hexulose-3-dehydrase